MHDMVLCCTYTSTSLLFARRAQQALVTLPDSYGIASVVALHRGLPVCIFLSYQHSQTKPLLEPHSQVTVLGIRSDRQLLSSVGLFHATEVHTSSHRMLLSRRCEHPIKFERCKTIDKPAQLCKQMRRSWTQLYVLPSMLSSR